MKRYAIDLDTGKCISCTACMIACMDQNDIDVSAGCSPLRQVFDTEIKGKNRTVFGHLSVSCMHCTDAPCITACPSGCLRKDPETNLTVFDTANCIGCHSCAMACPYGIPAFGMDGKMIKCDGCYVRVHQGLLPACVKTCPMDALKLVEIDGQSEIPKERSLREQSRPILKRQV